MPKKRAVQNRWRTKRGLPPSRFVEDGSGIILVRVATATHGLERVRARRTRRESGGAA